LAASAALLVFLTSPADGAGGRARSAQSAPGRLAVTVSLTTASTPIPRSFFGIGVEPSELESYAHAGGAVDRTLALLRSASRRSMQFRVGGYSADEAYWQGASQPRPAGVFELGRKWVRALAALSWRDRLRVSVAVNLAVHSPSMAAAFVRAVSRGLAPSALAGVAVGDEPDLYGREPWFESERVASTLASTPQGWTADYSPLSYQQDYLAYAQALTDAAPGVPLSGPEAASVATTWLQALVGLGPASPAALTVHRYPLSCRPPNSPIYPRIPRLLAERSSAGLAAGLGGAIALAHQAGLPLVVSEINSASCAGPPGVTDSFATALWAPDVLFELLRAGVGGVYWHLRAERLNSPFELRGRAIEPLPELYGLALFTQMLGGQARLVAVQTTSPPGAPIKVWAVQAGRQVRVLVINKGPQSASVSMPRGAVIGAAHLERLSAPSAGATTGVTLGGRWIGTDGRWHGPRQLARVLPHAGTYRIRLRGYSAALLQAQAP
jgi:hypothetical protein